MPSSKGTEHACGTHIHTDRQKMCTCKVINDYVSKMAVGKGF